VGALAADTLGSAAADEPAAIQNVRSAPFIHRAAAQIMSVADAVVARRLLPQAYCLRLCV